MKCKDRVLLALHHAELSPQELADILFVTRATVRIVLAELFSAGMLYRKFFHNNKTNRPDYKYCCVKYPPKYRQFNSSEWLADRARDVQMLTGDIDVRHIRFRKLDASA